MEQWREIDEFPGYSVSDQGFVRNDRTDRLLRQPTNVQGYGVVGLHRDGRKYSRSATILVANAFLEPDPRGEEYMTPIHLDGNKSNTRASNLRYRTRPFAIAYHRQFAYFRMHRVLSPHAINGVIIDVATGQVYDGSTEAAIRNGLLEKYLVLGIMNREPVYPTGQLFELVQ